MSETSNSLTAHQIIAEKQPVRFTYPGLYFLIRDNEIVYVGQSITNVLVRIGQHSLDKEFDSVTVLQTLPNANLNDLEASYIYHLEPQYNGNMPRNSHYFCKGKIKDLLGIHGRELNKLIRKKRLRPHLGDFYDIHDFLEGQ